jgi:microcystin-dependent protein
MSEPFLGEIRMVGFNFAPRGWAFCDGQLLPISQNTALFSLLGTTYGGDGRTTFGLPDLRGRVPIHAGNGPGLSSYRQGQKGGTEEVTLITNQIPSHSHTAAGTAAAVSGAGDSKTPTGSTWASLSRENAYSSTAADGTMAANNVNVTVNNAGGGQSHTNVQPFLAIYFCIALVGLFPSRS